jgi:phenylpropionate dioxygenase-like ring-hydroxylating dioxygenase large terminal subunit
MTVSDLSTPDVLAAIGGADPTAFDWREAWYPVFYLDDLDRTQPQRFTLLDQDLVIWWDGGQWRAFADMCPHRLAPLSEGRIAEDGLLECPYHGWAFNGEGGCDRLPQIPPESNALESPRSCVKTFATTVRQGLLFVYAGSLDNADRADVPIVPIIEEDADDWVCLNTFRDLPYDATTLLENVLDASHIPYTHHKTVGNRKNASTVDLELTSFDRQGFTGTWAEGPRRGTLGRQDTTFIAPGLMWHDLTSKQFGRTLTVVYATPIRKGECRLFARFPFKFASKLPRLAISLTPRWYSHIGQNGVLEDDQIFLHWQERYLETLSQTTFQNSTRDRVYAQACYLPTNADRFVLTYHKWLAEFGEPFPGQPLPPSQSREQLLDRYHSHTQHCLSCRGALKRFQVARRVLGAIGLVVLAGIPVVSAIEVSPGLAIGYGILTVVVGTVFWAIGRFERRFYEGVYPPPRNVPEKKS